MALSTNDNVQAKVFNTCAYIDTKANQVGDHHKY